MPIGARLNNMFYKVERLLLRSVLWAMRMLCHSAGQGRNFSLLAQWRLLKSVRLLHMLRTNIGNTRALSAKGLGRQQQ